MRIRPTASQPDSGVAGTPAAPARLARAALPIVAILVLGVVLGGSLWAASGAGTLGFDFLAYHQAANRVLAGQPLYDPSVQQTGGFGLFYYPPPFVLAILPLAPLDPTIATWTWVGLSLAAFLGGVALMPVAPTVRWLTILLAGLSWPFAYAFKLGQVGPLLFLLFAVGWRWLDRPLALGGSAAAGAIVKIQPGLVLAWALITRRWGAVAIGAVILGVAAAVATIVTGGLTVWSDYVAVLRNVSDPISTPHNFTPGAIAFQAGVPEGVAAIIQYASVGLALVAVVVAARARPADASYLVAVVASQMLSPLLWDHYAVILLLPVAWLLERRQWWAAAVPLATSIFVVGIVPSAIYPLVFAIGLFAPLVITREAPESEQSMTLDSAL